jgi:DNA-directed RNA polymerase specialized sigma24 family protein
VEDVVQDALRIVIEKGLSGPAGEPGGGDPAPGGEAGPDLRWCFQVLRHTIGNHYQKQRVRRRELVPEDLPLSPAQPTPLEALESRESARLVRESVEALAAIDSNCGRYMTHILEGRTPSEIAEEERLDPAVLYRRVYRCRGKLRSLLLERGVFS